MNLKIGDKVICKGLYVRAHMGKKGVVKFLDENFSPKNPFFGVEFEEEIQAGHDLEGKLSIGSKRGQWTFREDLEVLP